MRNAAPYGKARMVLDTNSGTEEIVNFKGRQAHEAEMEKTRQALPELLYCLRRYLKKRSKVPCIVLTIS